MTCDITMVASNTDLDNVDPASADLVGADTFSTNMGEENVHTAPQTVKEKGAPAPAPRKRAVAADVDSGENTVTVEASFKEGKLKDVTMPRLKNFIATHRLGKVSGKKGELMERVEAYFKAWGIGGPGGLEDGTALQAEE
eukprot:TRINITY_DN4635_c0_g1_i6.p2 TRINITY_DN4635_c0_g1~~TRINITY_DN4635_c0_g1_i6.p2  ORF type:complete len:140 (+),score=33.26 TRINITY_DN4635_c0_g1_i6:753-1172(+)